VALANGPDSFGLVTRTLHWLTAAAVLVLLPLGLWLGLSRPSLSTIWLYSLHKALGLLVLALVLLRLLWHRLSPPPAPLPGDRPWQGRLARAVHRAFYAVLILMPLAGWAGSSATGIDTVLPGGLVVPPIAPVSAALETVFFALHTVLAAVLAGLVALHLAGVVRRVRSGDGTLRRMIRGRAA
jgi:cytochrome b561